MQMQARLATDTPVYEYTFLLLEIECHPHLHTKTPHSVIHTLLTLFTVLASVTCWAVAAVGVPLADTHSSVLTQVIHAEVSLCWTTFTSSTLKKMIDISMYDVCVHGTAEIQINPSFFPDINRLTLATC